MSDLPGTLGALGSAWLLGLVVVAVAGPPRRHGAADRTVWLALGFGHGLGLTSALFFFASLVSTRPALVGGALEAVLGLAGLAWLVWQRRGRAAATPAAEPAESGPWLPLAFGAAAVAALVVAGGIARAEPFGSWDAWAIWNLRAGFVAFGGPEWPRLAGDPALTWTHPDYPLLLSASVARGWAWAGEATPLAPTAIALGFAAATVALLAGTAARRHGATLGWVGGLVLLGTPFFVRFAPGQHADIPLGFFILAALAAAIERPERSAWRWTALAGLAVGWAAWTKNDGAAFAAAAGLACLATARDQWRRDPLAGWLAGAAVALAPLIVFKVGYSPTNDLVAGQGAETFARLADPERWRIVAATFGRDLLQFGEWTWVPFVVLALHLIGPGRARWRDGEPRAAAALALTLAGYFVVYLVTPHGLEGHINASLVRLLLQLWPAALLLWCLAAPGRSAGIRRPVTTV